jgi:type II secretory pathway pseudopilin PulG
MRRRPGKTLVEMMVVVAIILLLGSIILVGASMLWRAVGKLAGWNQ